MGTGRRAHGLAFAVITRTQGSAMLAHALGDPSVVRQTVRKIANWIDSGAYMRAE